MAWPLDEIRRLDPLRDHVRIAYLDLCYEFPFESLRANELALFRTFASPSIATLLDSTGEFARRPQRRYDDTDLILSVIVEWGYDTERGRQAISRLNRIHGRYEIAREDMLYVLCTFVFEPVRFIGRWGRRPLEENERLAAFHLWRAIGVRMGIRDIPADYGELRRFYDRYEREHFRFNQASRSVALATEALFLRQLPGPLRSLGAQGLHALLDEQVLEAFGFARPPLAVRAAVEAALRGRAELSRRLPPRTRPLWRSAVPHPSYPAGFELEELGPPGLLEPERGPR